MSLHCRSRRSASQSVIPTIKSLIPSSPAPLFVDPKFDETMIHSPTNLNLLSEMFVSFSLYLHPNRYPRSFPPPCSLQLPWGLYTYGRTANWTQVKSKPPNEFVEPKTKKSNSFCIIFPPPYPHVFLYTIVTLLCSTISFTETARHQSQVARCIVCILEEVLPFYDPPPFE